MPSHSIIKSGYLQQKEGSLFNRWKKYWFVLTLDGKLKKFKKQMNDEDSHRTTPLQEYHLTMHSVDDDCGYGGHNNKETAMTTTLMKNEIHSARNICGKNFSMAITIVDGNDLKNCNTETKKTSSLIMLVAENEMEYEEWFQVMDRAISGPQSSSQHHSKFGSTNVSQQSVSYHMETLLSAVLDAAVISDALGIILSVNDAMTSLFGFSREELIGQNVKILMPSHLATVHDDYMKRYLKRRDKRLIGKPRTLLGKRSNGVTFPVELSLGEMSNSTLAEATPAYIAVFRLKIENDYFSNGATDEPYNVNETTHHSPENFDENDIKWSKHCESPRSSVSTLDSFVNDGSSQKSSNSNRHYLDYDDLDDDPLLYTRPSSANNKKGKVSDEATATNSSSTSSSTATTPASPQHEINEMESYTPPTHLIMGSNKVTQNSVVNTNTNFGQQQENAMNNFDALLQELHSHQTQFARRLHNMKKQCHKSYKQEFKELELKYQMLKHNHKFMEEENRTLQKHMDSFYESLRLHQAEMSILQTGNDYMDGIMLKSIVKEDDIYRNVLKTIAKKEHQLNLLKFLRKALLFQEQYSRAEYEDRTLFEVPKMKVKAEIVLDMTNSCEQEYLEKKKRMRQEATSMIEKFFTFSHEFKQQHENGKEFVHTQSMPAFTHAPSMGNNPLMNSKIHLSSTCEELLQLHSQFPTFGMFDMAISEVMERLKAKTFKRYLREYSRTCGKNVPSSK